MNIKAEMKRKNRLDELCVGERGRVGELLCEGNIRRRLLDVGLAPGTEVICVGRSPLGDPTAYLIKGSVIPITGSIARHIPILRTDCTMNIPAMPTQMSEPNSCLHAFARLIILKIRAMSRAIYISAPTNPNISQ